MCDKRELFSLQEIRASECFLNLVSLLASQSRSWNPLPVCLRTQCRIRPALVPISVFCRFWVKYGFLVAGSCLQVDDDSPSKNRQKKPSSLLEEKKLQTLFQTFIL